jgi:hypothetical protein
VDVNRKILSAGGDKHVDGEQMLLKDGSKQEDLWGAGLDLETSEMDFDSMINLRPEQIEAGKYWMRISVSKSNQ